MLDDEEDSLTRKVARDEKGDYKQIRNSD